MLPASRRVSNAIASSSRSVATTATASSRSNSRARSRPRPSPSRVHEKKRASNGFGDFVKRLSQRNEIGEDDTGQRRSWSDRKSGIGAKNSPLQLTVRGLKPFEVVERVNVLLNEERLDAAISMVENLPADTVNVVVWNCLISAAIKGARYKLAFELYYDMKRRHIPPNTRTFTTLFVGLSRIPAESWTSYNNILTRVLTAYTQLQTHFAKLQTTNPSSPDITPWPINGFLALLGKVGMWNKMWDVFFEMDGRLKPDEVTYSIMLNALRERKTLQESPPVSTKENPEENQQEELVDMESWEDQFNSSIPDEVPSSIPTIISPMNQSIQYRNAADARLLWDHLTRAHKFAPSEIPITSHHLAPLLYLLAHGKPSDQELGYQIVRRYLGLDTLGVGMDEAKAAKTKALKSISSANDTQPLIRLNAPLLHSLLTLCLQSAHHELAIHYFQTMASDPVQKLILDNGHMVLVMRAFAMRRPPKTKGDARECIGVLEWMMNEGKERVKLMSRSYGEEAKGSVGNLKLGMDHFTYAMMAAWRNADMNATLKVFEVITGLNRASFMSPSSSLSAWTAASTTPSRSEPRRSWKEHMSKSTPELSSTYQYKGYPGTLWGTTCMALLIKTASATNKEGDMKIALRILNHYRLKKFFPTDKQVNDEVLAAQRELATRTIRMVDTLLTRGGGEERQMWNGLKDDMNRCLERVMKQLVEREEDPARQLESTKLVQASPLDKGATKVSLPVNGGQEAPRSNGDAERLVTLQSKRKSEWAEDL